uniref:Uncharacterized protein n=1 Tax=Arundo donax TaxID=35708 RepID=A0A0A8YSB6_ARUDO
MTTVSLFDTYDIFMGKCKSLFGVLQYSDLMAFFSSEPMSFQT